MASQLCVMGELLARRWADGGQMVGRWWADGGQMVGEACMVGESRLYARPEA